MNWSNKESIVCEARDLTILEKHEHNLLVENLKGEQYLVNRKIVDSWIRFYEREQAAAATLIGKVIRIDDPIDSRMVQFYLVTDDIDDRFDHQRISAGTAHEWIRSHTLCKIYTEEQLT